MNSTNPSQLRECIPSDVHPDVSIHYRHNFIVNLIDKSIFLFGESFASISTILPVFVATFTKSPLLIGLVPAIINSGWFLPQVFISGIIQQMPKKMPFAKKMAVYERIPLFIFPVLPFLMNRIDTSVALGLFFFVIVCRGILGGMAALPWQEVIATVIPISQRGRFWGLSRLTGQLMGALGSLLAILIFQNYPYPNNYALCFFIHVISLWVSYFFFTKTIEPEFCSSKAGDHPILQSTKSVVPVWMSLARIFMNDRNFRYYLVSRLFILLGTMSTGFVAVYGIQHFHLTLDKAAVFSSILFISGIFSSIFWSIVGDRVGSRIVLLVSEIIWISALVLALVSYTLSQYYGVFFLMGFSTAGIKLGDNVLIMEFGDDEQRPYYLGMARTLPGVIFLIAPLVAGWLIQLSDYSTMFRISLLSSFLGFLFLWRVKDFMTKNKKLKEVP